LQSTNLSEGMHNLSLIATDSHGMTTSKLIRIEVQADGDGDRMPDIWENLYPSLNPTIDDADGDPDGDTLSNVNEFFYGTHPIVMDTDGDGYWDGYEVARGSDPLDPDSTPRLRRVYLPITVRKYTPVSQHPPYTPSNPSPADGATNQNTDVNLAWFGGDPDGDSVTYDIYFEANDSTPDVLLCNDTASTNCDPGTLSYDTHYYWKAVAIDEHGASTTGPVWDFTTGSAANNPPNTPSSPLPADDATDQSVDADLGWNGGDPDGDSVTYDIYFEANDSTPDVLLCNDTASTNCDPGTLSYDTHYYWKVVATDEHGMSKSGTVWDFTTVPFANFYVATNGNDNSGCGSPATACRTIQAAIDMASSGDTIYVMPGTYPGLVVLQDGVDLIGAGAEMTTIDGGVDEPTVICADQSLIDGFTIVGSGHQGIYCAGASPTIRHNMVSGHGIGIQVNASSGEISFNRVIDNWGQGVHVGGNSTVHVHHNFIAQTNYGIQSWDSSNLIENNVIRANIMVIEIGRSPAPIVKNNIILNGNYGIYCKQGANPILSYNDLWNIATPYYDCSPGTGSISADPLFVDIDGYDYHLLPCSPAIDAGDPASDYSNEPEPNGDRINMGAYGNTTDATTSACP